MKITETKLIGCFIIEPDVYGDNRGYFTETYNKAKLAEYGINSEFIQDNESLSTEKGTLRGIHLQNNPKSQAKLVRCTKGSVYDVAVDLRPDSPTYKEWVGMELSAENHKQLYIPRNLGHGFQTLTEDTIFQYKVDNDYSKADERGIAYNDPDINIEWPLNNPILSDKDSKALTLKLVDIK